MIVVMAHFPTKYVGLYCTSEFLGQGRNLGQGPVGSLLASHLFGNDVGSEEQYLGGAHRPGL